MMSLNRQNAAALTDSRANKGRIPGESRDPLVSSATARKVGPGLRRDCGISAVCDAETIGAALDAAATELMAAGFEEPRRQARRLLAAA